MALSTMFLFVFLACRGKMCGQLSLQIAALLLFATSVHAATCYSIDGIESTDPSMAPCDDGAATSACCSNNKGTRSDICMSSGLCYSQDGTSRGLIFMNGCTDRTGFAAACPHICPDGM